MLLFQTSENLRDEQQTCISADGAGDLNPKSAVKRAPLLATEATFWSSTFGEILSPCLKTTVSSSSRGKEAIHRAAVTGAVSTW